MAGVREQLDGPAGAPGGPYREPGAHVALWNQRMEGLQRVRTVSRSSLHSVDVCGEILLTRVVFDFFFFFSNLAFMIEMAQKELHKFR